MSKAHDADAPALLPDGLFERVGEVLRVLGHPDRLRLVERLIREELSVAELAERIDLAPHAVSQHLKQMQARGILARRREGRRVYYSVVSPVARSLMRCMWQNGPALYASGEPEEPT